MSRFNVSTNHPLIPNANEYMYERQYVSIHSEDRNVLRFPSSSEFELELPQDYCNVQAVRLDSWTFPSNYSTFSLTQNNITIAFEITNPYNPDDYGNLDQLLATISHGLVAFEGQQFIAIIEEGFYNPFQIATELTNAFNNSVTVYLRSYISQNAPSMLSSFNSSGGYDQFVVVYNEVSQKLWFGNKSSDFVLSNDSRIYLSNILNNALCFNQQYPSFSNWGLPAYLGFSRCPAITTASKDGLYPRFFYGSVMPGDNGYWLVPDSQYLGNSTSIPVYYLEAPYKINLMGNSHFYLEIDGMNSIDEMVPFSVNAFTFETNETSGVVKSSFAKIAVTTTPLAQWYDNDSGPSKIYNPPAERIRRLKLKLRYHNGELVNFGSSNFSIMLEFIMYRPQQRREYKMFVPESIKNS